MLSDALFFSCRRRPAALRTPAVSNLLQSVDKAAQGGVALGKENQLKPCSLLLYNGDVLQCVAVHCPNHVDCLSCGIVAECANAKLQPVPCSLHDVLGIQFRRHLEVVGQN